MKEHRVVRRTVLSTPYTPLVVASVGMGGLRAEIVRVNPGRKKKKKKQKKEAVSNGSNILSSS